VTKAYDKSFVEGAKQPSRRHVKLYQVDMASGLSMFFCDADTDVSAITPRSGGQYQLFRAFGHDRQEIKMNATLQIDVLDIGFPAAEVPFNGRLVDLRVLALGGIFDRASMYVYKWDNENPAVMAQLHSQWIVQQATSTRSDVSFRCENYLTLATRQTPRTTFQAECNNRFGSPWCGFDLTTVTDVVTCVAPTDVGTVYFSSARATGWFDGGLLVPTSGLAIGLRLTIQLSVKTSGIMQCILVRPLPWAPSVGVDTFQVVPGCDKRMSTCLGKFNNLYGPGGTAAAPTGGFRGFPDIPKPVDTLGWIMFLAGGAMLWPLVAKLVG